jgi:hypothetical protein
MTLYRPWYVCMSEGMHGHGKAWQVAMCMLRGGMSRHVAGHACKP